jgi:ABC-type sulfate/molybdate transport systems ATPase subunit
MTLEPALWTLDHVSLGPSRLSEVSLTIREGATAVLGPSGAGKTSLLNLLVGFDRPERGIIDFPKSLFWAPQNGGLWPHCTAREHLDAVRAGERRIAELLSAFDLGGRAGARPSELSGGEQSRLAVARALAAPAKTLVMDEPLAHVDPARLPRYWAYIRKELNEGGRSLVFSTHSPETVLSEAQEVVCLRGGKLLFAGTVGAAYSAPPNREVMECLGPGNWLTPEEADLWLDEKIPAARCYRPEQIEIFPAHISDIVVRSAAFFGGLAEVELRHVNAAVVRTFFHRPSGPHLNPDAPAAIRLRK